MDLNITVLLVDDHPIVRSGCRQMLNEISKIKVHEAVNGDDAYRLYKRYRPDVVILDITLPGTGGLEVLKRIRAWDPKAQVIMFSMHEDPVFASRSLQDGALGYVTKHSAPDDLVTAVQHVARGQAYLSHDIAQQLALSNRRTGEGPLQDLSRRELELLRLFGEGIQSYANFQTASRKLQNRRQQLYPAKEQAGCLEYRRTRAYRRAAWSEYYMRKEIQGRYLKSNQNNAPCPNSLPSRPT